MLLWYVGPSIVVVHQVFATRGLDYRLITLGALLPLLVDAPTGRLGAGHSLLAGALLLAVVVLATVGRPRLLRRRLVCLPIGYLCGLVLSGAFLHDRVFLWPFLGISLPHDALLPPLAVVVVLEAAGAAAVVWAVDRFGVACDARRRRAFLREGRLTEASR